MGGGTYDPKMWDTYSSRTKAKATADIFKSKTMDSYLDPKNIKVRESRDSAAHADTNAIILGADVTGSMGILAENIAKKGFGTIFNELLARNPIRDPQVMAVAYGDIRWDRCPLQMTQFECEVAPFTEQLEKIFLEHGGGANGSESQDVVWYAAGMLTSIDCMEKRGKKGYLFTAGDEEAPLGLPRAEMLSKCGITLQADVSPDEALEMAQRSYNVYHLVVDEGSHCRRHGADNVFKTWVPLLGQNVVHLSDVNNLAEVIVSIIEVAEGRDKDAVAKSWSGATAVTVANALKDVTKHPGGGTAGEVVRF